MESLLVIGLALVVGLAVLFFFLGIGRVVSSRDQNTTAYELMEALSESEVGLQRAEAGLPDPKTWAGYWYGLALRAGSKFNNQSTPGLMVLGFIIASAGFGFLVFPGDLLGMFLLSPIGPVIVSVYFKSKIRARLALMDKQSTLR